MIVGYLPSFALQATTEVDFFTLRRHLQNLLCNFYITCLLLLKIVIRITYIFAFNISSTELELYLMMRIIAELKLCDLGSSKFS